MPTQPSFLRAGITGWPVSHSLSPRLHRFWLQSYNIEGSYEAFPVKSEDLDVFLRGMPTQGLRGVNLTIPHKEASLGIVDRCDAAAQSIGAVNLVIVDQDGTLHGHNTDAYGFTQNLLISGFTPFGGTAMILGAGGAARAVIVALADMGFTEIRIANRTADRAQKLAQEFSTPQCRLTTIDWKDAPNALSDTELLVNTTSLGMHGQPPLNFPLAGLPLSATVTDIIYAPLETTLLQQARQRGHRVIDGLGMLLHQARPSFAAFFGRDPQVTPELRQHVLADRKE